MSVAIDERVMDSGGRSSGRNSRDLPGPGAAAAVVCACWGVLSVLAFVDFWMGVVPALAILLGVVSWRRIAANPMELTGKPLATVGVALGTLFWAGGASWLSYVYVTEVPEGCRPDFVLDPAAGRQ